MTNPAVVSKRDNRGVVTLTLNNPDKHNAFDDGIIAALQNELDAIETDDSVRAVVLASTGKSFSAGADLGWMKRMASYSYEENLTDANALAGMLKTLNFLPQPTIARVQGAAFGGAVGLVSCCDMAVAASKVSFSLSEVKIGLIPATISPYVVAAIGARAARRYFTTAERFSAQTALELGLVSEVVDAENLDQQVDTLLSQLLSNGPLAVRAAKALVFDVAEQAINNDEKSEALYNMTGNRIASIRGSDEGKEGLTAFLEKRPASWLRSTHSDDEA